MRAVEVRHLSAFEASDQYLTGMPLAFLIWSDEEPEIRVLHLGDTCIFSDLKLLAELYRPTIAFIGIGAAPGFFAEMAPSEGAQAALWLGLDVALPMHFEADPAAAGAFCAAVEHLPRKITTWVPKGMQSFVMERKTHLTVDEARS